MFNHSVRSYLFGELLAARGGSVSASEYDSESLFLGCVLHDLGAGTLAAGKERFEIEGADLAARTAHRTWLRCRRGGRGVWEAIALHSSFGIAARRGPLCYLVNGGGNRFRAQLRFRRRPDRRGDPLPDIRGWRWRSRWWTRSPNTHNAAPKGGAALHDGRRGTEGTP